MSIESELQDLVTQTRQLDVTFRDELVDTNTDLSSVRTRVTNIEIQLGLPDDNASSIPGGGGGNSTRPDSTTNLGNDVIEIDIAGELIWLWNPLTNSWVSIPFTSIAPPVAVDVQSVIDQANAAIDTEITAKTDALLESIRATLISTQQTEIDGLAAQVTTLGTTVDGNTAAIQNEATARADANTAMASTASTLAAQVEDNHTAFTNFQAAVVADPDGAAAEYLQGIQADVASNTASLATEISTRATADSALSTQVSSLVTSVGSATAAVQQEVTARTTAVSAVTSSVTSLASRVGTAEGAISNVQSIVAGLDGSSAAQIDTLTTNVGNLTTTVQDVSSSVNGIEGKRSLAINANGQVTGIELLGGGTTGSQIKFQAASFIFYDPSTGVENAPFVVSGGVTTIKTAAIGNASIGTLKIAGNAVIVPATMTRSDSIAATGNFNSTTPVTSMSLQIYVPYACTLVILYQAKQGFSNWNDVDGGGSNPWNNNINFKGYIQTETQLLLDGSVIRTQGSGAVENVAAINHSLAVSAGWHTVSTKWRGQRYDALANVYLGERNLTLLGAMR
jgi:hypothetical protein